MRYVHTFLILTFCVILVCCKKEHAIDTTPPPVITPTPPVKHILLKDITIPRLGSPYYHFEYNADSLVSKADFDTGLEIYDVLYNGKKISEMRDNIIVNHDTLRYVYDNTGKVGMIKFISQENILYRLVFFTYNGDLVTKIEWDHKVDNVGYSVDRTMTFSYYPDGNTNTITDHRTPDSGSPEQTLTTTYEHYDEKINVDDFSIIHDAFHDHLLLLQGFRLQKNNPGKETLFVDGVSFYTIDYTYAYNADNTPSTKTGAFIYTSGPNVGERFQTNSIYSYY